MRIIRNGRISCELGAVPPTPEGAGGPGEVVEGGSVPTRGKGL